MQDAGEVLGSRPVAPDYRFLPIASSRAEQRPRREGLADVHRPDSGFVALGPSVRLMPFERTQRPDLSQMIKKPPHKQVEPVNAPPPTMK